MEIKAGSVVVKIYRNKSARMKSGYLYQLAYHDGTSRQVKQFSDLEKAKETARNTAEDIQAGRSDRQALSIADVDLLNEVRKLAGNVSPTSALREWNRARAYCGDSLIDAAKTWKEAHAAEKDSILLSEVVEKFKAAKARNGVNTKKTYRSYYENLCDAFPGMTINRITSRQLTSYLNGYDNPVYRNTHRRRIVTLFRWSARQGYLPQNAKTQAELTDNALEPESTISFFTPEQIEPVLKLIANEHSHYLPALILAAFLGMRRTEVHNQVWEDIDLKGHNVTVTKAKPRTPADRIIPIPENAVLWLMRCKRGKGPVCHNLAIDRIRDICRDHEIEMPANGFRHSFISYQMSIGRSAGKVAQWAGNTERQIHRHYRRPRPASEGKAYFDLTPHSVLNKSDKVIPMKASNGQV